MANYNYKHVIKLKASTVLRFFLKHIILSQYMCLISRRAKLGQIQGGLQRAIQDSTKGGLQQFFYFFTR